MAPCQLSLAALAPPRVALPRTAAHLIEEEATQVAVQHFESNISVFCAFNFNISSFYC